MVTPHLAEHAKGSTLGDGRARGVDSVTAVSWKSKSARRRTTLRNTHRAKAQPTFLGGPPARHAGCFAPLACFVPASAGRHAAAASNAGACSCTRSPGCVNVRPGAAAATKGFTDTALAAAAISCQSGRAKVGVLALTHCPGIWAPHMNTTSLSCPWALSWSPSPQQAWQCLLIRNAPSHLLFQAPAIIDV